MAGRNPQHTAKIFVVDDDDSARTGLLVLLTAHGYAAEGFCSAQAFLDRLPIETVGCLILDIQTP